MATLQLWLGISISVAMIYALVKRCETKVALLGAGFLMAIVSGNPMAAFKGFSDRMVYGAIIEPILSVMGFAFIMKYAGCDAHLTRLLTRTVGTMKWLLIPGAGIVTAIINVPLTSAAGVSAAVGAILIPLLMASGVRPALAAAAVYTGTFGALLSPGNAHNVFIATKLAHVPVMEVIKVKFWPVVICVLIGALSVTLIGMLLKENKGFVPEEDTEVKLEKANPLYAILPMIPIAILVVSAMWGNEIPWLKKIRISHAMLIGAMIGIVVTRINPAKAVDQFFRGTGSAYSSVMAIIICAAVFVEGLTACGVTAAMNDLLRNSGAAAKYAATWGPMLLALVTGSGDAATLAFNEAISPHAADFGMTPLTMGLLANIAGAIGRTASPLSGAIIVCAGFAKVSPVDVAKRTAPGMILASIVVFFWFSYVV